jgi:L,D-transpeptidase catalytic domain
MPPVRRLAMFGVVVLLLLGGVLLLAPSSVRGAPANTLELLPGEYLWLPELSPRGPVLVLVSLPEQRAYIYRNGVRIGVATVSTGKPGFETPTGVFTILQKAREHYSNLYDDAPMPFMQRLTWDGVAMHAGRVPGYPASHGCVRLPQAFAEKLFDVTTRGMTVVIVDQANRAPMLADPALFPAPPARALPVSTPVGQLQQPAMPEAGYTWAPERAPPGALTVVVSTRDREVVVMREGVEIGRGPVQVGADAPPGTRAYLMLEGFDGDVTPLPPDRPRRRWLRVHGEAGTDEDPARLAESLVVAPGFARAVYDAMAPGSSLVITDEPLRAESGMTVMESDVPAVPVDSGSDEP